MDTVLIGWRFEVEKAKKRVFQKTREIISGQKLGSGQLDLVQNLFNSGQSYCGGVYQK